MPYYCCIALEQRAGFNQHPRMEENLWEGLGLRAVGWGSRAATLHQPNQSHQSSTCTTFTCTVARSPTKSGPSKLEWGRVGKRLFREVGERKGEGGKKFWVCFWFWVFFFFTSFSKSSHILDFHFYFTVGEKGGGRGGESSHATHSSLATAWNVVAPSNKVKTSNTVLYPWAAESLLPTEL